MMLKDVMVQHALWNIRHLVERMEELLEKDLKGQARISLDAAKREACSLERHLAALEREHFKGKP